MIAALRSVPKLRRHWKLAAISAFSLSIAMALGILGLSVSNSVLALPPAAPAPDRLVMIYDRSDTNAIGEISYPDYQYYRNNNHVFTDIAAAPNSLDGLSDFNFEGRQVNLFARSVSENYFAVLGIRPYLGHLFSPGDDEGSSRIAVMTYSCWKRLGADPNMVGKVLARTTIIGITPKEFTGAFFGLDGDLFTTIDGGPWRTQRTARQLSLLARLKPGLTRREANADVATLAGQLASAFPREDKGHTAVATRATLLPPDAIPTAELMSGILMALVLLVLLIACANVANLLLAVAVGRRQEAAIKLALGAPRGRLVREFIAESAILCSVSGVLGFLIATAILSRYSDFTIVLQAAGAFSIGLPLHHSGLYDLAGARIGYGGARAPSACGAMHPVDHVVANVHGVSAIGEHVDLKCIAKSRGLECLVPPPRAFKQGILDVVGRARVHPISDGLDGLAHRGRGIFLFEAMPPDVALHHGLADRRAVVDEVRPEIAGTRIVVARLEAIAGEFDQRVVLAQRDRVRRGSYAGDGGGKQVAAEAARSARGSADGWGPLGRSAKFATGGVATERQQHFDLGVFRERLRSGRVDGAARAVETVRAGAKPGCGAVAITHKEIGGVDKHASVAFGDYWEAPQDGLGKGIFHGQALSRVGAGSAEGFVGFNQHHLGPVTLERNQPAAACLSAIESDVVRAESSRQARDVEEGRVEARDFEEQIAAAL